MDILIFAILTLYIGFRLWRVLGMFVGGHQSPSMSMGEVVILSEAEPFDARERERADQAERLRQYEPEFDTHHFLNIAEKVWLKTVQAFAEGDIATLRRFVLAPLCRAFECKIQELKDAHQERHVKVLEVKSQIAHIQVPDADAHEGVNSGAGVDVGAGAGVDVGVEVHADSSREEESDKLRVFVTFESEQIIYTKEADGTSYDNPSHLPKRLCDTWIFVRTIGSSDPTWYIESTSAPQPGER